MATETKAAGTLPPPSRMDVCFAELGKLKQQVTALAAALDAVYGVVARCEGGSAQLARKRVNGQEVCQFIDAKLKECATPGT
jgi:hypothetical protein